MPSIFVHPTATTPAHIARIQKATGRVAVIGRHAVHLVPAEQWLDAQERAERSRRAMYARLGINPDAPGAA